MFKKIIVGGVFACVCICGVFSTIPRTYAQELAPEKQETMKAEVIQILEQDTRNIEGTDTKTNFQSLQAKILTGSQEGTVVTVENDYLNLAVGDVFYLLHTVGSFDGMDYYSVSEPYRLPALYFFIGLFVVCVLVFGGWQGFRGLVSLAVSFLFIFFVLFPGILGGYSPILVSMGVASLIIVLGSYITHGFNKTTTSAVIGMVGSIVITGALAHFAVQYARLSGFNSEEAVYLNFNTGGSIDFVGLLLGGILIGLLGVLYDAAIGQAIAVEELHRAGPHLSKRFIFTRAIRMGREHIGALVNTLAIAYVGVSLPLLLLFYSSTADITMTMNREIFATEIIRTMIGSIGLVLAVPITTLISVFILVKETASINDAVRKQEESAVKHLGHLH